MKWSWRIGKLAGIDIHMHLTFLILVLWIGVSHYVEKQSVTDALAGIGFILLLFFIIVLHELGHALTARRFGVKTESITLLPIGGVARLDHMPEKPKEELMVAIAGPLVNVVIAGALAIGLTLTHSWTPIDRLSMLEGNLAERLFFVNVVLVAFNLIPAFPMDGGRVLRAILAMNMNMVNATRIAATVGQSLAIVMGFVGLFFNPFLVFIAFFVWLGAAQEAQAVEVKSVLSGIVTAQVMVTQFESLHPADSLEVASRHVLAGFQEDFPVMDQNVVIGVLTRDGLLKALARGTPGLTVEEAMEKTFVIASPSEPVHEVLLKIKEGCCGTVPVVSNGKLVGLLTMHNVGEYLMIGRAKGGEGNTRASDSPVVNVQGL